MQGRPSWELTSVRNAARLLKEFSHTDRELGVLFRQPRLIARLHAQFLADWAAAQSVPAGGGASGG